MKLIQLLKHTRVDEAPLGDYELVGNWGDKEKSHGFRHATDRKMLQNPSAVKITRKKFGNTEHVLNFYFVNLPEASSHSETGFMTPEQIQEAMPNVWPEIAQRAQEADHANSINVLFVGNTGANRMNMTPWIMAHRMAHAFQSAERSYGQNKRSGPWGDYESDATHAFQPLLDQVYGWERSRNPTQFWMMGDDQTTLAKFFEGIGGMRSARKGNLGGRPYEFLYEMFAQFVTTGQLTFRECPKSFGLRNGRWYRVQDQEVADMYSRDLNDWIADQLGDYINNILYAAEGKFLVM
jgi:hypothetical protein